MAVGGCCLLGGRPVAIRKVNDAFRLSGRLGQLVEVVQAGHMRRREAGYGDAAVRHASVHPGDPGTFAGHGQENTRPRTAGRERSR